MTESNSVKTPQIEELIVRFIEDELVGDESVDIDTDENLLAGRIVDSVGLIRLMRNQAITNPVNLHGGNSLR